MNIEKLNEILLKCYSKDLCYSKMRDSWSEDNKCLGMCAITSLVVQEYCGGIIGKICVQGVSHYFNVIDDRIVDLTSSQFSEEVDYTGYKTIEREDILFSDTKERYEELKRRVSRELLKEVDKKVFGCKACGNRVEKFPDDETVFIGHNQNIVLIGEAPANNGWRKSHMLWRDINGKMLSSGVVLQRLFDIIDSNVLETTFLEAVKCYPSERKNLKFCSTKCRSIMLEQLDILKPKLVITLGEFPTRSLLNFKFDKFSQVVGKIYDLDGYKVLPIYHPSPISPKSYKGNVPIFEELKRQLEEEKQSQ